VGIFSTAVLRGRLLEPVRGAFLRVAVFRAFFAKGTLLEVRRDWGAAGTRSAGGKSRLNAKAMGRSAHIEANPEAVKT
jgi:hypothetical protein